MVTMQVLRRDNTQHDRTFRRLLQGDFSLSLRQLNEARRREEHRLLAHSHAVDIERNAQIEIVATMLHHCLTELELLLLTAFAIAERNLFRAVQ